MGWNFFKLCIPRHKILGFPGNEPARMIEKVQIEGSQWQQLYNEKNGGRWGLGRQPRSEIICLTREEGIGMSLNPRASGGKRDWKGGVMPLSLICFV